MTRFHDRTLALLCEEAPRAQRSVNELTTWAANNNIVLPAAFLEWAKLDDGALLRKYSNDDWFMFEEPTVVEIPSGARGLLFHSENQNNFDRIVMLDQGDDPPVLYAWVGAPPWVTNAETFSQALFAQIFDWQYWLEFDPEDPDSKEMAYTGDIHTPDDSCLSLLRTRYEESVSTRYVVEDEHYVQYRFIVSPTLRLTVTVGAKGGAIQVAGPAIDAVRTLEKELSTALLKRS